jgi:outer membrane lipoprotein-sorting protein
MGGGKRWQTLLAIGLILGSPALPAAIDPEAAAVIANARSQVGTEEALKAVETLRFVGLLENFADNSVKEIELLLQKPGLVRMTVTGDEQTVVIGIDDYEGWRQITREGKSQTTPLPVSAFWETRFGSIDNLYFFQAVDQVYGEAQYAGTGYAEGKPVDFVDFRFNDSNQYRRAFSKEDGNLVQSLRKGTSTRTVERAREVFDGIVFATEIEQFRGEDRVSRFVFSSVEVNPEVDPALFRYPVD